MKVLLVVVLVVALTYLAVRFLQDRGLGGTPAQARPRKPKPPTRPLGPDDDDSFLRDLEWKRRQEKRHRPNTEPSDPPETGGVGETP